MNLQIQPRLTMNVALALFSSDAAVAVLLREFRAAFINRYLQVFAAVSLIGGIGAAIFSEDSNAVVFFLLQVALYIVSLFAVLAGVSSAQTDHNEWQFMFAQPVARGMFPLAKFVAYISIFAGGLLLLFVPALFAGANPSTVALLYGHTLLLAAVFFALGLCAGFFAHDRSSALMLGVAAWLILLFVIDLVGLFAARWELVQRHPDVWVAVLMLNPLDAFRIHALFTLEQIPSEAANKTLLAGWWIAHAGTWFVLSATAWSAGLLAAAVRQLNQNEH
jgi:hypothetical protein